MTQITTFMKNEHRLVSARVLAALKTLETELGVTFRTQGGVIGQASGIIKLAVEVKKTATGGDPAKLEFERQAHYYGLKGTDYRRTFYGDGVGYRVIGFNPGSPKFCMSVERIHDLKIFKFTKSGVISGLAAEDRRAAATTKSTILAA